MSYSLNSLKGGSIGAFIGDYCRAYKGDTRSLDYFSNMFLEKQLFFQNLQLKFLNIFSAG